MALTIGMASTAAAYVGPGAGLSLLGALWGLLIAVGAALWFVILWPLRRMRKRARQQRDEAEATGADHGDL
jgi:Na+/proline symporter